MVTQQSLIFYGSDYKRTDKALFRRDVSKWKVYYYTILLKWKWSQKQSIVS